MKYLILLLAFVLPLHAQPTLANSDDLALKAPIANPTFTGTVGGITKSMVGLGSVENTALSTWPGSTAITTLGTIATGTVPAANVSGLGTAATADSTDLLPAPVAVADADARKLAATYTAAEVAPVNGLRVIQTDLPDVVWTLLDATDITQDANWAGSPRTDEDGALALANVELTTGMLRTTKTFSSQYTRGRVSRFAVIGTITLAGNIKVTVTAPAVAGSPYSVHVAVALGDTNVQWSQKIADALNADATVNALYYFNVVGGVFQMQEKTATAADAFTTQILAATTGTAATGYTVKTSNQTIQQVRLLVGTLSLPASEVAVGEKMILTGKLDVIQSTNALAVSASNLFGLVLAPSLDYTAGGTLSLAATSNYVQINRSSSDAGSGCNSTLDLCLAAQWTDAGSSLLTFEIEPGVTGVGFTGRETINLASGAIQSRLAISSGGVLSKVGKQPIGATDLQIIISVPIEIAASELFVATDLNLVLNANW